MYPYKCFNCNGSYYRCGTGEGKKCGCGGEGGKYCWEDEMVLILRPKNKKNKIIINGNYDGYGRMYISDKYKNLKNDIYWEDFNLYPHVLKNYSSKNNRYYKQLCVDIVPEDHGPLMNEGVYIYCRSCYDN